MFKTYYQIHKPVHGERKSFSMLEVRRCTASGSRQTKKISSPYIDDINDRYLLKKISLDEATALLRQFRWNLYLQKSTDSKLSFGNEKILKKYWKEHYSHRILVDKQAMYNDLKRALLCIEPLCLRNASRIQLQKKLSELEVTKQRRCVARINQILSFSSRNFKLMAPKKLRHEIQHVSEEEMKLILNGIICPDIKALVGMAFYSGLRLGECFAVEPMDLKHNHIQVRNQMTRECAIKMTKNRGVRRAFLFNSGLLFANHWANVCIERKHYLRKTRVTHHLADFSKATIGRKIAFHDLRHSYAILLIKEGVSITLVSQSLGNSAQIANEYYAGFSLSSESIASITNIVRKG